MQSAQQSRGKLYLTLLLLVAPQSKENPHLDSNTDHVALWHRCLVLKYWSKVFMMEPKDWGRIINSVQQQESNYLQVLSLN